MFLVRKRVGQDRKRVFAMKVLKKAKVAKDARYEPLAPDMGWTVVLPEEVDQLFLKQNQ